MLFDSYQFLSQNQFLDLHSWRETFHSLEILLFHDNWHFSGLVIYILVVRVVAWRHQFEMPIVDGHESYSTKGKRSS